MSNVNETVAKAWSDKVGRKINFECVEVEAHDGRKQTQLINPETGAVVVAVNATGSDAEKVLVERAGEPFIDAAFSQPEIDGPNQANQLDKSDNNVRVPAGNPGAAVEAGKGDNADKLEGDLAGDRATAEKTAAGSKTRKSGSKSSKPKSKK